MTCTNPAAEKGTFTCGTKVGNPKRARWAYHACLGIQLFSSSCWPVGPAT